MGFVRWLLAVLLVIWLITYLDAPAARAPARRGGGGSSFGNNMQLVSMGRASSARAARRPSPPRGFGGPGFIPARLWRWPQTRRWSASRRRVPSRRWL